MSMDHATDAQQLKMYSYCDSDTILPFRDGVSLWHLEELGDLEYWTLSRDFRMDINFSLITADML